MYKSARSLTILDQFTPEVLGMFWFTGEELDRELLGFDDFNYLFDGLISQYLYRKETQNNKRSHIFFTDNFQSRIFLAHLRTKDHTKSELLSDISEQIALVSALKKSKKKILVFNKSEYNWTSELQKSYPEFQFKELEV